MTYSMTGQSLLFTAYAVAGTTAWNEFYRLTGGVLPLVGVAGSVVMPFTLQAAYERMVVWREKEKAYHPLVVINPDGKQRRTLLFSTFVPWVFLLVWGTMPNWFRPFWASGGGGV